MVIAGVFFFAIILLILTNFFLSKHFGPKRSNNKLKNTPYEAGVTNTQDNSSYKIDVKFYLIAVLFVAFDVEVLFMLPWAVNLKQLGYFGLIEMVVFIGLLLLTLIYIFKKRALKWQ